MKTTQRCLLIIALSVLAGNALAEHHADGLTLVHAGTLLAVPGEAPVSAKTLVVDGGRIVEVRDGYAAASDFEQPATIVDLRDKFVLPGLMDMHVHLLGQLGPESRTDALYETTSMAALKGAHYARVTLEAGFTTVRDLGGDPEAIYALRDATARGIVPGPRIFAAGSALAATGGHGDVDGYKAELLELWTPDTICDGPYDCRRAARSAIKYGADWIKITATGGVLSDTKTGTGQQMTDGELGEIVATAHSLGVRVAAHAHGADGINAALAAGVDSIDHGTFLDNESIRLFKKSDAWLVPTLMPGDRVRSMMEGNPFFTDAIRAKANAAAAASKGNFERAVKAGVNVAFGTDAAVIPHGDNAEEFTLMVNAGMSPAEAIRTATVNSAMLLEMQDELGTLEPGKIADMIAVDESPLENIAILEDVKVVIRDGKVMYSAE